jgi:hypothetical protein
MCRSSPVAASEPSKMRARFYRLATAVQVGSALLADPFAAVRIADAL